MDIYSEKCIHLIADVVQLLARLVIHKGPRKKNGYAGKVKKISRREWKTAGMERRHIWHVASTQTMPDIKRV